VIVKSTDPSLIDAVLPLAKPSEKGESGFAKVVCAIDAVAPDTEPEDIVKTPSSINAGVAKLKLPGAVFKLIFTLPVTNPKFGLFNRNGKTSVSVDVSSRYMSAELATFGKTFAATG